MKYIFIFIFSIYIVSCGYPDIDNVPDFKNINLTNEELEDYCTSLNSDKNNISKCINNYNNNK